MSYKPYSAYRLLHLLSPVSGLCLDCFISSLRCFSQSEKCHSGSGRPKTFVFLTNQSVFTERYKTRRFIHSHGKYKTKQNKSLQWMWGDYCGVLQLQISVLSITRTLTHTANFCSLTIGNCWEMEFSIMSNALFGSIKSLGHGQGGKKGERKDKRKKMFICGG